jgi:two-component system nitrogen regulation sensor histidine kinase NtrY
LDPFTHVSQLETIDPRLYRAVEGIRPNRQHLVAVYKEDGAVQLLIKASSFLSENEELMLLSVQDIQNELDEKEIDSWRELIRVMRHEIMNSVAPITSLSESLSGYLQVEGQVKTPAQIDSATIYTTLNGLELIHEQARGLLRFVESYRQLTKMPEPEKRKFPVRAFMNNICILAQSFPNAGKIELVCKTEPGDLELLADEKQISQVMVNLVKNAFQALEHVEGARVSISSGPDKTGHPQITISDNGPGIPSNIMDKIFIPFFTTKENGSGIGLSLSRQIMQMHGGNLKIRSIPGKQTRVVLSF